MPLGGGGAASYSSNFLSGDGYITDGSISASGFSGYRGLNPSTGTGVFDANFQVAFTVSAPVQVELDQEVDSSVGTVSVGGTLVGVPTEIATSMTEMTGPAVGTIHYANATDSGVLNDDRGSTSEKFILYPNGVYTFISHQYGNVADDPTNTSASSSATSTWNLYATGSPPTIGTYTPTSSSSSVNYSTGTWNTVPNGGCIFRRLRSRRRSAWMKL
jgi:hypothetical protein